ncbi:hypothetical protein AB6A68_09725 [Ferrimicrobium acidiphilum]|uniref:Uncharacterized protein n=1 Tax=Ferrimicrobium acidiphilum TaxID=121039 RepID=A0ABV3Y3J8_9ACTN
MRGGRQKGKKVLVGIAVERKGPWPVPHGHPRRRIGRLSPPLRHCQRLARCYGGDRRLEWLSGDRYARLCPRAAQPTRRLPSR